jgi:hypothetical protein
MNNSDLPSDRKLKMALIGGGGQAFIGPVHVAAATLDHRAELVRPASSRRIRTAVARRPTISASHRIGPTAATAN